MELAVPQTESSGCLSPRAHSALCAPQPPSAYVRPDNSINALIPAGPKEHSRRTCLWLCLGSSRGRLWWKVGGAARGLLPGAGMRLGLELGWRFWWEAE